MQANLYSQIFCGLSEEDLKFYEQINQQIMENTKKAIKERTTENELQQKKDNSFLATEPLGKLLLKLSLPTVTAQIINMLYNIVDRIYIGHIPENGALALTGVGVCMPLIMIVSAFAALVGNGGAPRASIFMGKGDKESAERTLGNCFTTQIIVSLLLTIILFTGNRSFLMAFGASEKYHSLRCCLYEYLFTGNYLCTADFGYERFYYCTGICQNRHVVCFSRRCQQHYTGSCFYFRISYGRSWCCSCNDHFPGTFLRMGVKLPYRKKIVSENPQMQYETAKKHYPSKSCTGTFHFYHAGQ